jgi:hypothetical protein
MHDETGVGPGVGPKTRLEVDSIEYVNDQFSQIMSRWDSKFKNGNTTYMHLVSSIIEANRQ